MNIYISNASDIPIYNQISAQIKNMIINGELHEGDSLPSMRTLAKDLRISLITTKRAYEELEKDGFIKSYTGKGSFVCPQNINVFKEETLKKIEDLMTTAISYADMVGISSEELTEMLHVIYENK